MTFHADVIPSVDQAALIYSSEGGQLTREGTIRCIA